MSIKTFWNKWNRRHLEVKSKYDAAKLELNQSKRIELKCPKCHSEKIHINTRGYRVSRSLIGNIVFGPIGLLMGFIGKNKLLYTCKECGYQFIKK